MADLKTVAAAMAFMLDSSADEAPYPRFFTRPGGFASDALYVRFDAPDADAVVVTATGTRPINNAAGWSVEMCLVLLHSGQAVELTADEAHAIAWCRHPDCRNCNPQASLSNAGVGEPNGR